MTEKERGETTQKHSACARCLSWNHKRNSQDCRAPKNSCRCPKNGSQCSGDYHTLVCKSGVVYCNTVKIQKSKKTEEDQTLLLLQDIKINNGAGHVEARAFFDSGSNQVLIRDGFGIDKKLRSQHVKY